MFKKIKAETKAAVIEIKDKKRGEKWTVNLSSLCESRENLVNLWRGWYQIFSFKAEERPDFEELKWCLRAEESLALVRIDIGSFAKGDLSGVLDNIADILSFFSKAGKGIILRVVYDTVGRGMKREPANFEKVGEHLKSLTPLIARFSEEILVYQGLLVGSWGEMHDSAYLSPRHLRWLMKILLSMEEKNCYFAVRTPLQWRQLVGERDLLEVWQDKSDPEGGYGSAWNGEEAAKKGKGGIWGEAAKYIGLFDDGMFGSENHLGTFGIKAENEAAWEEPWRKKDELTFESEICRYVPNGGEAVGPPSSNLPGRSAGMIPIEAIAEEKNGLPEFQKVLEQMRAMNIVYLNSVYDKRVLDVWRDETWKSKDIWNGISGYEYIGCRLGYRFVLRKMTVHAEKKKEGKGTEEKYFGAEFEIEMENIGFGAFPRIKKSRLALVIEREGEVVWKGDFSTKKYRLPRGGQKEKFCLSFPLLEGTLYFRLEALVRDQVYPVYLGNKSCTEKGLLVAEIRKS